MDEFYPVPRFTSIRADPAVLEEEFRLAAASPYLELLIDFPTFTLLTNKFRQIVWANREALLVLGATSLQDVAGRRPGEALECVYSKSDSGGCGTTEFCAFCGAAKSLEAARGGFSECSECSIRRGHTQEHQSIDLLVWARPIRLEERDFILFTAQDLTARKRREALERVFYHDILNTASSLRSLSSLLVDSAEPDFSNYLGMLEGEAERLLEEIESQRSLKAAEDGELDPAMETCDAGDLIEEALKPYLHLFDLRGVVLDRGRPVDVTVWTDRTLARRILVNMIKNALEASQAGNRIFVGVEARPKEVEVRVRNSLVLNEEQRRRIFHRSYSTKGAGRGLGTYGMKLLGERFLGCRVEFDSTDGAGTTFRLIFPASPPP